MKVNQSYVRELGDGEPSLEAHTDLLEDLDLGGGGGDREDESGGMADHDEEDTSLLQAASRKGARKPNKGSNRASPTKKRADKSPRTGSPTKKVLFCARAKPPKNLPFFRYLLLKQLSITTK